MLLKKSSKKMIAIFSAVSIIMASFAGYAVYASKDNLPPWILMSGRQSWSKEVEGLAAAYPNPYTKELGIEPTNLGFMHSTWNPGPNHKFPYTGVTWMRTIESGDKPVSGYEKFDNKLVYCAADHVNGGDLRGGTQFFWEANWDENNIPTWVNGTGDQQKFNFYMMCCAIGVANSMTDQKGPKGADYNFTNTDNDYNGAAEFIATFPIIERIQNGYTNFDMTNMTAALEQYRGSIMVKWLKETDLNNNPTVKAQLEKPTTMLVDGRITSMSYMDALFCNTWQSAMACMLLHSSSSKNTWEITHNEDGSSSIDVICPFIQTGTDISSAIYYSFECYGDWKNTGYTYDQVGQKLLYRLVSDTGEVPEDGVVAKMIIDGRHTPIGFFIAGNNSKLSTFKCWSNEVDANGNLLPPENGSFDKCQTFFAVYGGDEILIRAGASQEGDSKVKVDRYRHEETWQTDYNVDLAKFDSETGKPLEGAVFDILEKETLGEQLHWTDLDNEMPEGDLEGTGSFALTEWEEDDPHDTIDENYTGYDDKTLLNSQVNRYNWGNDQGSQFARWTDPLKDVCQKDVNVTGEDGHLYYGDNNGNNSGDPAHSDIYKYKYMKGYCTGHPAPKIDYVEVPEEEVDEEGDVTNQDAIDSAIAENKRLHKDAWTEWNRQVQTCERLAREGGFFHVITPGSEAKEQLQEDRDVFYVDFISLTYDYSALETESRNGYILHGLHTDDIPIEWRTVTSSQYKDYSENDIWHNGSGSGRGRKEPNSLFALSGANEVEERTIEKADILPAVRHGVARSANFAGKATSSDAQKADDEENGEYADLEISADGSAETEQEAEKATVSDASSNDSAGSSIKAAADGKPDLSGIKTVQSLTGLSESDPINPTTFVKATVSNAIHSGLLMAKGMAEDDDGGKKGGLRDTISLKVSQANTVTLGSADILDWTFIVYDHRTEGEIHFNKKDLDLAAERAGYEAEAYADDNGDGSLEGALYGLFASEDIIHPDGKTGVVYKQGNLVAVATTDRNGDASFMAVTEAPGYRYDYVAGKAVKTNDGWAGEAPNNLHIPEADSAAKESDLEEFVGHNPDNTEITAGNGNDLTDTSAGEGDRFHKYSSNQEYADTYREDETTGSYPIADNKTMNGNCWIGRPLFVSGENANASYYIKELSRSEGYELSVTGKGNAFTNGPMSGEELNNGLDVTTEGDVSVTEKLFKIVPKRENRFGITAAGTVNGYDVTLDHFPAHAVISTFQTETVWSDDGTHMEEQKKEIPVIGTAGQPVLIDGKTVKAAVGDSIMFSNGGQATVNAVSDSYPRTMTVTPENAVRQTIPAFTGSVSTTVEDFCLDADWAIGQSRLGAPADAPWMLVELTGDTAAEWAVCLHDGMTAAGMGIFNRITIDAPAEIDGHTYAVVRYAYGTGSQTAKAVYDEQSETLYVKQVIPVEGLLENVDTGFVYIPYRKVDLLSYTEDQGFVIKAVVTRKKLTAVSFVYPQAMDLSAVDEMSDSYWIYDGTEQERKSDGSLAFRTETSLVEMPGGYVTKETVQEVPNVTYDGTSYQFHMDVADGLTRFKITYDTDDEIADAFIDLAVKNGTISVSPTYQVAESFIEFVRLAYPGQDAIIQDAGTITVPVQVLERPIRQKIKVTKDIQTLAEPKIVWYCKNCGNENQDGVGTCGFCGRERTSEETKTIRYDYDTYSAVHKDNISADRDAGIYNTAKDWLASLLGGGEENDSAADIPNFRFKTYLKSNLERIYRNHDGNVVWVDRNGNVMAPQYQDTDGDGNYDTFDWKYNDAYGQKTVDFPEKDLLSETGVLESANVQKIYTSVRHHNGSMTTSSRANNLWDVYLNPQYGETDNVAEKDALTTSLREDSQNGMSGKAVDTNAALYSYRGKNTDVAQSDRINDGANTGYTRLLETRGEDYNYDKFFDAIHAANTDIWDNDMHSTYNGTGMANYPGQHWFETHYEKYQMDDADPDHTLANTDGVDADGTAGGDRNTSFKPFRWIREHGFGDRSNYEKYPAEHNGVNTETNMSTSDFAKANAEASDAVRQFAVKWYLQDEAGKLMTNNGVSENIAGKENGTAGYEEEVYDEALFRAIAKAYNYLKPFYENDLDTIYSVEWDSAENGGTDHDYTTLSIDLDQDASYYNVSAYLPYGTYVVVEQQPERRDGQVNDFENRNYTIDAPKEVRVPSVYDGPQSNYETNNFDPHYQFVYGQTTEDQAKAENYLIRFGEEWAQSNTQDEREYVIRAHNANGDYEIYKYGLDLDKLTGTITYPGGSYPYAGFKISQEELDPLKDYYNTAHRGETGIEQIGKENGGCDTSHYNAEDLTNRNATANGGLYDATALTNRFFYASVSEDDGKSGEEKAVTGVLTAINGQYGQMLVPWSVTVPADLGTYSPADFTGCADLNFRDGFYKATLRINKTDSETGEYILHDNAIFALYAGSRYNTFAEIEADAKLIADAAERARFLAQFKPGDAKFYLKDTVITGSREFLEAMRAENIKPAGKGRGVNESSVGAGELCSGLVKKDTPICLESERIMLSDDVGARTGQMTVYTTLNDVLVAGEGNPADKVYANQNTGYFETPQPIGAGVYVLAELKPPVGYARSKPVAYEVYSDKTSYYVDGDMYNKVAAVRYESAEK